ncbi:transcriptional regulator, XRE family [Kyrpidia tusciae DSM 2912]|uniref:Transcriptional regulator, XRE family n=2 Tax=Kyrpidia TaxID=1129704 RepID=A0ACA8Z5U2_9BACL|nr:transcriptional regulator, XRE family [Kyrpidia tusciae DSM 2912]CAB3390013.1 Transcriptional regulator, XRE family [Kyrpidia spormannii]
MLDADAARSQDRGFRCLLYSPTQCLPVGGVKQSAIARLETGNAVPRLDTLIRIADALDLRLELVPREAGSELSVALAGV